MFTLPLINHFPEHYASDLTLATSVVYVLLYEKRAEVKVISSGSG